MTSASNCGSHEITFSRHPPTPRHEEVQQLKLMTVVTIDGGGGGDGQAALCQHLFLAACPRWAVGAAGSSSRCANSCLNFIFWLGWVKVKTYDGDNGDGEINLLYQALVIPLV